MRKEKGTVILREIAKLSQRMRADDERIQKMILSGHGDDPVCKDIIEQSRKAGTELASMLMHHLSNTTLSSMGLCPMNLPFIRAAFTATADRLGELDDDPKQQELHDEVVRYIKTPTALYTMAERADVFEMMRAQGDEKKETEGE